MADPRKTFKEIIYKQLIGPSNDTFIDLGENELVTGYPLNKYFSGIIFPRVSDKYNKNEENNLQTDEEIVNEIEIEESYTEEIASEEDQSISDEQPSKEDLENEDFTREEIYPNSFGISFCLDRKAEQFNLKLKFGLYRKIDPQIELNSGYKIKLNEDDYNLVKNLNTGNDKYLSNLIGYDKEKQAAYLRRTISTNKIEETSEDIYNLSTFKKNIYKNLKTAKGDEKSRLNKENLILQKLTPLYLIAWERVPCEYKYDININKLLSDEIKLNLYESELVPSFKIVLYIKLIKQTKDYYVIKVLAENGSDYSGGILSIYNKPVLNKLCMFQSKMQIESPFLRPFPEPHLYSNASLEDKIIDCQYRDAKFYALAHNCSCKWNSDEEHPLRIETEFLPEVIPPVTDNCHFDNLANTLNIYLNSYFSESTDEEIIHNLEILAESYGRWIKSQENLLSNIGDRYKEAANQIVKDQKDILQRIYEGINILKLNSDYMKLYKLANSAMLVNMAKTKNLNVKNQEVLKSAQISYHPFQLAFLLINIECIVNEKSEIRNNSIDLLWFPTGGGKTEAYFLLTIFFLLFRRYKYGDKGLGTSVIMRYTLRLLTAQQFERASKMILSLNYVCSKFMPDLIKTKPYSIGLWIGQSSTPNKLEGEEYSAAIQVQQLVDAKDKETARKLNRFPINDCPWCGKSLIDTGKAGFMILGKTFKVKCISSECEFNEGLPLDFIDESIYNNPPSLLFSTVDKFARLAWVDEASSLFGRGNGYLPPGLIIQDELHLISGPLGSITALYEDVIEMLCCRDGNIPRIIASTATIKNAASQVRGLFGNREVITFPPPGINYDDNFFAKIEEGNLNREYIGICPTGKTFTTIQIKLLALLLYCRLKVNESDDKDIDNYWTIVSYHNSLRELGRIYGKVNDEIKFAYSHLVLKDNPDKYPYIRSAKELTSRVTVNEIKNTLKALETKKDLMSDKSIDLAFATNMISAGLDIPRLNIILMNGQPKSISEYIQVTSRIARKQPGLVCDIFNPIKARDKSHYENFISFHNNYYRFVEPISVTPYTKVAIAKMLPTILATYLRHFKNKRNLKDVIDDDFNDYKLFIKDRVPDNEIYNFIVKRMDKHIKFLYEQLEEDSNLTYKKLLKNPDEISDLQYLEDQWVAVNSLRDVNPSAVIKVVTNRKNLNKNRGSVYD